MMHTISSVTKYAVFVFITVTALSSSNLAAQDNDEEISTNQPTILITGANRGIGLGLAKQFSSNGYKVIATARKPEKATELADLGVQVEALDISSQTSVDALAAKLDNQAIDMLLNNAGISGHNAETFAELNIDKLAAVMDVNALGALRVTQGLLPNLMLGKRKVVASMSSRMGSIEDNNRGCCYGYRASKTALNSFNKGLALEFADVGFTFTVLHPGWVKTDMTSDAATYTPTESAGHLYNVINKLNTTDNGKFYDLFGKPIPW